MKEKKDFLMSSIIQNFIKNQKLKFRLFLLLKFLNVKELLPVI